MAQGNLREPAIGISEARMEKKDEFVRYFNIPRGRIRSLVELPFYWLCSICCLNFTQAIRHEFRFYHTLGYISECLKCKNAYL